MEPSELEDPRPIRVCPVRDTICPHGMSCPYSQGYNCDIQASRAALRALSTKETDHG